MKNIWKTNQKQTHQQNIKKQAHNQNHIIVRRPGRIGRRNKRKIKQRRGSTIGKTIIRILMLL